MKPPPPPLRCLAPLIASAFLALAGTSPATISVTAAGYTNDFSTAPPAGDWITSTSNIAGMETTFSTVADVDDFVITNNYNAATLVTALGSSATDPPSVHQLARHNTTRLSVQMRPRGTDPIKAANVLVARLQNNTGSLIPSIDVSYTFDNPGLGVEEIPGWNAYYSVTGNSNWIKIPAFSTATPGVLTANLNFGGTGWSSGALAYILWVDDNAVGLDENEASYTMDEFSITVPVTPTISAVVSSVTRGVGGNATDPADDTVSFNVTVTGNNLPGGTPGFTTTGAFPSPPVTGAYGSTFTISNAPLSSLPLTVGLADRSDPSIRGDFTVSASSLPPYVALNLIGTPAFVTLDASSAPQWTPNGATMRMTLNNGGATAVSAATAPITFPAGPEKCVSLVIEAEDSSIGTNFEAPDTLRVELLTDAGNRVLTSVLDKDANGTVNGYSETALEPYLTFPLRDEFNREGRLPTEVFTTTFRLHGIIPAGATTAQIVVTGANDSASETFRVQDIIFTPCVDSDGDGVYDSEERVEGTNPGDAGSWFRILDINYDGTTYSVNVPTVTTRNYQLDTSTDLVTWTPQSGAVIGTGGVMTFSAPADGPRKFLRVTVQ